MQLKFLYLKIEENLVGLPPQKSNDGEFIVVASNNMVLLMADQKFQQRIKIFTLSLSV